MNPSTNTANTNYFTTVAGQLACVPQACGAGTYPWSAASASLTVTCAAPAATNSATTLLTTGFVEYAEYLVRARPSPWPPPYCPSPAP